MPLFKRKPKMEKLPEISAAVRGQLEVQASRLAKCVLQLRRIVLDVPGLSEYGQKVLVPKVMAPLMMQQWEKVYMLLVTDTVIGVTVSSMVSAAISNNTPKESQ